MQHCFVGNRFYLLNRKCKVDNILLAGYLKLIPAELIRAYPKSILNIHPSLLPSFGGKGYYGMKVHRAVIASGVRYDLSFVKFSHPITRDIIFSITFPRLLLMCNF